ncbi:MAG: copper resistance protein CopC [Gemmatimonadota bacterium]
MKGMIKGVGGLVLAAALVGAVNLHFGLAKSLPAADSSGPAPEQLQLWFTQAPQDGTVTIRLIDAGGDLVETGEVTRSDEDPKMMWVDVDGAVAAGAYTVAWRGIGDDGHVIRDDFAFSVAADR